MPPKASELTQNKEKQFLVVKSSELFLARTTFPYSLTSLPFCFVVTL